MKTPFIRMFLRLWWPILNQPKIFLGMLQNPGWNHQTFWTVRKEIESTDVRRGIFETVEGLLSAKLNILLKRITDTQVSLLSILSKVTQFLNNSTGIWTQSLKPSPASVHYTGWGLTGFHNIWLCLCTHLLIIVTMCAKLTGQSSNTNPIRRSTYQGGNITSLWRSGFCDFRGWLTIRLNPPTTGMGLQPRSGQWKYLFPWLPW